MENEMYILWALFAIFGTSIMYLTIPYLKKLNSKQFIRNLLPEKHKKKTGTPTMGGIIIFTLFLVFLFCLLIFTKKQGNINYIEVLFILIPTFIYALIGFLDDFLIVCKHNNKGLPPLIKTILEIIVSVLCYYLYLDLNNNNLLNFFGSYINIGFFYGLFLMFMLVGVTNATNLTDGIDGLLGGCSFITFGAIGILGYYKENSLVVLVSIAICISLFCFLIFNLPKARLFMGNVGSLMLGALMVALVTLLDSEILLIFFGFPYLIETLSVIVQVWYYKRTKGQRVFRMTPFHHHLELSGFSEWEIDYLFYLLTIIFSSLGVLLGVVIF